MNRLYLLLGLGIVAGVLIVAWLVLWPRVAYRFQPVPTTLDQALLDALEADIRGGRYGNIHSVLIWREDELLMEAYFDGYNRESLHPIYSVTKSVTSAAFGIGRQQGYMADLDRPVATYFDDYEARFQDGSGRDAITVRDLLTMTGGFEWDEVSSDFQREQENNAFALQASDDWLAYMFSRPIAHEPGTQFTYNSGGTVLLGEIMARETEVALATYVDEVLFKPLAITEWRWESNDDGIASAGWGLHLRPIDMMKIGRLYLRNGEWEGRSLIPAEWVAESTRVQVPATANFTYGYHWWQFPNDRAVIRHLDQNDIFLATGYGGQYIVVVPHLDMVIVSTAQNRGGAGELFAALKRHCISRGRG